MGSVERRTLISSIMLLVVVGAVAAASILWQGQRQMIVLRQRTTLPWITEMVFGVDYSPDNRLVAVGDGHGLHLYDTVTLQEILFRETRDWVYSVSFSPDGRQVAGGTAHGKLLVWNVAGGEAVNEIGSWEEDRSIDSVRWSPDGDRIIGLANWSRSAVMLDTHTGDILWNLDDHLDHNAVAWSPDGQSLAIAPNYESPGYLYVGILNAHNGTLIRKLPGTTGMYRSMDWSPDGIHLAFEWGALAVIQDVQTGAIVAELDNSAWVSSVAWSPDGLWLAVATDEGLINIWNMESKTVALVLSGHNLEAEIAWSPDGHRLVSGSRDGSVLLWNVGQLIP